MSNQAEEMKLKMARNQGWWIAVRAEESTRNPYGSGTPEAKAFTDGYRERRKFDAKQKPYAER